MKTLLKSGFTKKWIWVSLFAIAMGYLETSVVVYLRKVYYPDGFEFPLKEIDNSIAVVEFWREFATMVMLLFVGIITGKTRNEKFAWFIYSFAIWDIFYYIFLYVILGWPASLFDWDILFLIPVPWVGPVLAPVIIATLMVLLAIIIIIHEHQGKTTRIDLTAKLFLITGCFICIVSFCQDYLRQANASGKIWMPGSEYDLFTEIKHYIPQQFNWYLFATGLVFLIGGIHRIWDFSRHKKNKHIASVTH